MCLLDQNNNIPQEELLMLKNYIETPQPQGEPKKPIISISNIESENTELEYDMKVAQAMEVLEHEEQQHPQFSNDSRKRRKPEPFQPMLSGLDAIHQLQLLQHQAQQLQKEATPVKPSALSIFHQNQLANLQIQQQQPQFSFQIPTQQQQLQQLLSRTPSGRKLSTGGQYSLDMSQHQLQQQQQVVLNQLLNRRQPSNSSATQQQQPQQQYNNYGSIMQMLPELSASPLPSHQIHTQMLQSQIQAPVQQQQQQQNQQSRQNETPSPANRLIELRKEILSNLPKLICHDGICGTSSLSNTRCQVNKTLLDYFIQSELARTTAESQQIQQSLATQSHPQLIPQVSEVQQQIAPQQLVSELPAQEDISAPSKSNKLEAGNLQQDRQSESSGGAMKEHHPMFQQQQAQKVMEITKCPHTQRKHYAKNMCSSCYRKYGRNQNAWNCPHKDRLLYSMGMCQTCYLSDYHKRKVTTAIKASAEGEEECEDMMLMEKERSSMRGGVNGLPEIDEEDEDESYISSSQ